MVTDIRGVLKVATYIVRIHNKVVIPNGSNISISDHRCTDTRPLEL